MHLPSTVAPMERRARSTTTIPNTPVPSNGWSKLERHRPALVRQATARLHCPHWAEDVVQEVLVRVWQRESCPSWTALLSLTELACRHAQRTAQRRHRHECGACRPEATLLEPWIGIARGETRALVHGVLDRLPPDQREAIRLHDLEGLDYGHIAELVDAPATTVRTRVSRSRRALAVALSKRDDLEACA